MSRLYNNYAEYALLQATLAAHDEVMTKHWLDVAKWCVKKQIKQATLSKAAS
jgi:hypothetical protein